MTNTTPLWAPATAATRARPRPAPPRPRSRGCDHESARYRRSLGITVAVFQWGWGLDIIGLDETVPIISFVPIMLFAILFGLSMDYKVFLLSRVREEWHRTEDNHVSVANGIAGTGRVITSAAIIMIAVFLAFVGTTAPILKMVGLGLAAAILIDATIVRMVLVPSAMALMGRANWWLPEWLDRILPKISVEAEETPPTTEIETTFAGAGVAGSSDR